MHNHIEGKSLFHDLSEVTRDEYSKKLDAAFDTLEVNLIEEIANIMRDCNSVVAEAGQIPEAEQDSELASALEAEIDGAEEVLTRAQNALGAVVSQHKVETRV